MYIHTYIHTYLFKVSQEKVWSESDGSKYFQTIDTISFFSSQARII